MTISGFKLACYLNNILIADTTQRSVWRKISQVKIHFSISLNKGVGTYLNCPHDLYVQCGVHILQYHSANQSLSHDVHWEYQDLEPQPATEKEKK